MLKDKFSVTGNDKCILDAYTTWSLQNAIEIELFFKNPFIFF